MLGQTDPLWGSPEHPYGGVQSTDNTMGAFFNLPEPGRLAEALGLPLIGAARCPLSPRALERKRARNKAARKARRRNR